MACQVVASLGAAPASVAAADISACLPKSVSRSSLVTEDLREVSALAGRVMSLRGSTPIRPINGRRLLAPSSLTRSPIGWPCGLLSQGTWAGRLGRLRAYHVPSLLPCGLGRAYSPVVQHLRQVTRKHLVLTTCRFGPSGSASCACWT